MSDPTHGLAQAQAEYEDRDESYYQDRALDIQDAEDAKADRAYGDSLYDD
jgi:hypothetical protein